MNRVAIACIAGGWALFAGCGSSVPTANAAQIAGKQLVERANTVVLAGLDDGSALVRASAIEVAASTSQLKFMPKVQQLLTDEYVPVRFAAALAMGDMQFAQARGSVAKMLADKDENVRLAAAYALYRFGETGYMDRLLHAVDSNDQTLRANAVLLLGRTGEKGAVNRLYRALRKEDSDDKVRFQAIESIAMLGDERIYPKIWALLLSAYADDRVIGVRAMGSLKNKDAKNSLLTMLDDHIPEVRLGAAEQLGLLGDTSGKDVVIEVLTKNSTADNEAAERTKMLAAMATGQIRAPELTKFLPTLIEDQSKFVQLAAAKAIFLCARKGY